MKKGYSKVGQSKSKKQALKDIKESEKQVYIYAFPYLRKLIKEIKVSIDTTKL